VENAEIHGEMAIIRTSKRDTAISFFRIIVQGIGFDSSIVVV
jgi:hypothetical protein